MPFHRLLSASALAVTLGAGAAAAQSVTDAVEARQSQFKLFAFNLGALVPMAQGNADYDAEVAAAAAEDLLRLVSLDQTRKWPEGSDNAAISGTRAQPSIWEDPDDFVAKLTALREAVAGLEASAGDGLDAMRAALGPVGAACSACHEAHRAPQ
jgi:cytochrome c556